MDRRAFLAGSAALLAAPLAAEAQGQRKVHRIGVLGLSPTSAAMAGPNPQNRFAHAFVRGMRELGYIYGVHFVTETRGAEGKPERYASLVADLVGLKVDVIVAVAASLRALKQATSTIPVVMTGSEDPVGLGYVTSLAHPGGNITGVSLQLIELTPKRLELLKQLVPTKAPVAVVFDMTSRGYWQSAAAAARERGWTVMPLEISDAGELQNALRAATTARVSAVIVNAGLLLDPIPGRVAELVADARLPAIYRFRYYVDAGGLMSYGADLVDSWRQAAVFVDKIFKGAKPADLPIEQPTKFELVINLKTAKALGLTIPPLLLARADQVIE
jgi:putative tryptophan/tyrosine transport system substrate-binding protein